MSEGFGRLTLSTKDTNLLWSVNEAGYLELSSRKRCHLPPNGKRKILSTQTLRWMEKHISSQEDKKQKPLISLLKQDLLVIQGLRRSALKRISLKKDSS